MTTKELKQEVALLQSAVIGIVGRDPEGEYRPEFVARILAQAKKPALYRYDPKTFHKKLQRLKRRKYA